MESFNELLKKRVENVLDMAVSTVSSLTESFASGSPLQAEEMKSDNKNFGVIIKNEEVQEKTEAGNMREDEESVLTEVSDGGREMSRLP